MRLELTTNVGIGGFQKLTHAQQVEALALMSFDDPPRFRTAASKPTGKASGLTPAQRADEVERRYNAWREANHG